MDFTYEEFKDLNSESKILSRMYFANIDPFGRKITTWEGFKKGLIKQPANVDQITAHKALSEMGVSFDEEALKKTEPETVAKVMNAVGGLVVDMPVILATLGVAGAVYDATVAPKLLAGFADIFGATKFGKIAVKTANNIIRTEAQFVALERGEYQPGTGTAFAIAGGVGAYVGAKFWGALVKPTLDASKYYPLYKGFYDFGIGVLSGASGMEASPPPS